jgi:hypothetical protein
LGWNVLIRSIGSGFGTVDAAGAALLEAAAHRQVDGLGDGGPTGAAVLPDFIGDVPERRAAADLGERVEDFSGDIVRPWHFRLPLS